MAEEANLATEIARLIKKRGTYKGHQTKAVSKLALTDGDHTAGIDYHNMDSMLESAQHNLDFLEEIRDELIEVNPAKEADYQEEFRKSTDTAATLMDSLTLRSQRGHACRELEGILRFLTAFRISETSSPTLLMQQIQRRDDQFEEAQGRYRRAMRTDAHLQDMVDEITEKLASIYTTLPTPEPVPGPSTRPVVYDRGSSDSSSRTAPKHRKLPVLQTPIFTGNVLDWESFWRAFSRNVHTNRDLDEDEKLAYLQQCVKDKSQSNLIDSRAGDYRQCVANLKEKYHQPRYVYSHYLKTLYNCTPAKDDSTQELTRLHQTLSNASKRMDETGLSSVDASRAAYIESLLPVSTWRRWMELNPDQTKVPDIKELLKFLDLQGKLGSRDTTIRPAEQPRQPRQERQERPRYERTRRDRNTSSSRDDRPTREVFAATTTHACICCKATDHSVYGCPKFKGMAVEDRSQFATTTKLCYNCLCPSHDKRSCKSTFTCRRCSGKHHTLLHRERGAPRNEQTESTPAERSTNAVAMERAVNQVGLETVPIEIEDTISPTLSLTAQSPAGKETTVTALYDPGAQLSLISVKVANQLGLIRRTCNVRVVQALGSGTVSASAVIVNLTSHHVPGEVLELTAVVVPKIGGASDNPQLEQTWDFLDTLQLADPHFRQRRKVDVILGQNVSRQIIKAGLKDGPVDSIWAQNTIWGWMVQGQVGRPQRLLDQETTATCSQITTSISDVAIDQLQADCIGNELLQHFFQGEALEEESVHTVEEQQAIDHFGKTHKRLPGGRMQVALPRRLDGPELGSSREAALRRYIQNERSLTRRKVLQPFQRVMEEYFVLNHAEVVPKDQVHVPAHLTYYMPLHAVTKDTSTTTKLRIVFDASARSSNGVSLNDTLLTGPTVHPPLTEILMKFRRHRIGMTADISKMYREISLEPTDRDYHRFLWRKKPEDPISDCRMMRVTFGVSSSPFLATQIIQQIADNVATSHPEAAQSLHHEFYVDDFISGSDTASEAIFIQQQVYSVLDAHKLKLRKWRSSSNQVLQAIAPDLLETEATPEHYGHRHYLKTLGIQWDAIRDDFYVSTSELTLPEVITKRALTSDIARTFDVMGWYAPATLAMKALIQQLWAAGKEWDEPVPPECQAEWKSWREELPLLASRPISRPYFKYDQGTRRTTSLHGFADASLKGYAAVVYIRSTYHQGPPHVQLIQAKTKVAPLKGLTIPRLELCGAQLLSGLVTTVRKALDIPLQRIQCWTDSQIVLYWLDGRTRAHKTYVANRVRRTLEAVPPQCWKHVPGIDNPADCASRGITPGALQAHGLWWHGPAWLSQDPIAEPPQPRICPANSQEELIVKKTVAAIIRAGPLIEERYSTYHRLRKTVAWILRFARNARMENGDRPKERKLDVADIQRAEAALYRRSQKRMINGTQVKSWERDRHLLSLNPTKDQNGIYRVNGRLRNSPLDYAQRNPIILGGTDILTRIIIRHHHFATEHAGPTLLMSTVGRNHYVIRGLTTVKAIVRNCVTCRRTRMETENQLMGQLPRVRVTPGRPFSTVGTDFAGPVTIKKGHTRRPVHVKAYVCVFVCLVTKATHLEVVSSLSTEAFMSCLIRFVSRRGLPTCIASDNGSNFIGASRELEEIYQVLRQEETQQAIINYCGERHIEWRFNPARAPHFGGLWEAAVRSFKLHFRRLAKSTIFDYEEITTILCRIETALNSRPLMPIYTHSSEGVDVLTPGHFLIGQPLNALPERQIEPNLHPGSRYQLCQKLSQAFWQRWSTDYLRQLHKRTKWQRETENVKVGDIALLRGETTFKTNSWPMARVVKVFPGEDGLVRAVDLQTKDHIYRRPVAKLTILVRGIPEPGSDTVDNSLPPGGMFESETQVEDQELTPP